MKYTETEMFEVIRRLARIFLESYPNDRQQVERFVRWAHEQYGYRHDDSSSR